MPWSLVGVPLGIAGLVLGLSALSRGLARLHSRRFDRLWRGLSARPWQGVLISAALTALTHSSSAFTISLVALAEAGVISVRQAVPLVMGANVGTTVTSQLLAASVRTPHLSGLGWALAITGVGVWAVGLCPQRLPPEASNRPGSTAWWGETLGGLGLILLGLEVLGRALAPLGDMPWFTRAVEHLAQSPLSGIGAGAVLTSIVLSSTVTIAILQRLAAEGLIGLPAALPVLFGDNIGTTTDTLLVSAAAGRAGRAVAVAHLLFNLAGTVIFLPLVPAFTRLLFLLDADPARQIAHAHTLFNVASAALLLPFHGALARASEWLADALSSRRGCKP